MTGYTKLFGSIVASTIWSEDDQTRIVWITMLAMSNQHGEVHASVPGLAKLAQVPLGATESALQKLASPDKYSRTKDHDGRRIQEIDGGWLILNHAKYRAKADIEDRREQARVRAKRYRDRQQASVTLASRSVTLRHALSRSVTENHDKQKQKQKHVHVHEEVHKQEVQSKHVHKEVQRRECLVASVALPPAEVVTPHSPPPSPPPSPAIQIIEHLNKVASRSFRPVKEHTRMIEARLAEVGDDLPGVLTMIDRQACLWRGDMKMDEYLRPQTLFAKTNFANYYDARTLPVAGKTFLSDKAEDEKHAKGW